jgi:hypothetical protein
MNSKKLLVTLATAAALCASSALASDIYRYTDEEGTVHYVDRPSGEPTEERMYVASQRTNNSAVQARYNERYRQPEPQPAAQAPAGTAAEEEPEELSRAERKAATAERAQQCQSYRNRMQTLVTARRLYREDESGERVYLDDAQIQEARDKVQELIEEFCD